MMALRKVRGTRSARSGFTLIELLAVMLLTGVLTMAAVPAINSIGAARKGAAQRQIARDLNFARERAVVTGATHRVSFNIAENSYSTLWQQPGPAERASAALLTEAATGRPSRVRVAQSFPGVAVISAAFAGRAEVGFNWRGQPLDSSAAPLSAAGEVTITGNRTITVRPISGLITIN